MRLQFELCSIECSTLDSVERVWKQIYLPPTDNPNLWVSRWVNMLKIVIVFRFETEREVSEQENFSLWPQANIQCSELKTRVLVWIKWAPDIRTYQFRLLKHKLCIIEIFTQPSFWQKTIAPARIPSDKLKLIYVQQQPVYW